MSKTNIYYLMVSTIAGISFLDAFINVLYPVHNGCEENPLAKLILILFDDNLTIFIGLKLIGTLITTIVLVYLKHFRISWLIVIPILIIQIFVISYMFTP